MKTLFDKNERKNMRTIPLVDIRNHGLVHLVELYPERTKELVAASRRTLGIVSEIVSHIVLARADRLSKTWLAQGQNPYLEEIDAYAARLDIVGIHALNICFEWGCTSSVYTKDATPTLIRALDWLFPKLGENLVVAHQRGSAGSFYNVTWPGGKRCLSGHGTKSIFCRAEPSSHASASTDDHRRLGAKSPQGL